MRALAEPSVPEKYVQVLHSSDCDGTLDAIATRAVADSKAPWLAVLDLNLSWRPWEVLVQIADSAVTSSAGSRAPPTLQSALAATVSPVETIPTSNVALSLPHGQNKLFAFAPAFETAQISIRFVTHPDVVNDFSDWSSLEAAAPIANPPLSNAMLVASHAFVRDLLASTSGANRMFSQVTDQQQLHSAICSTPLGRTHCRLPV